MTIEERKIKARELAIMKINAMPDSMLKLKISDIASNSIEIESHRDIKAFEILVDEQQAIEEGKIENMNN